VDLWKDRAWWAGVGALLGGAAVALLAALVEQCAG